MNAAETALEYVRDGQVLGLGTGLRRGRIHPGPRPKVQEGLNVRGVATSKASTDLAASLGIPLVSLDDIESIDVAFDGADEVDPKLQLIKGRGGALVREKIVAAASKQFVVLVGPEKLVETLGDKGDLPVEIVPFALGFVRRKLAALGCKPEPRIKDGQLYVSDNGNPILDCRISALPDPAGLERSILAIPGVLDTGLFLGMTSVVIVGEGDSARVLRRPQV